MIDRDQGTRMFPIIVPVCVLLVGAVTVTLGLLRSDGSLVLFWLSGGALWTALGGLWWCLARAARAARPTRATRATDAPRAPAGRSALTVLAVAAAARLAVLLVHRPALSDDVYRYVLDGHTLAAGHNPYLDRPRDRLKAEERWPGEHAVARRVNNPELHTIYLPASQWVFGAIGLLGGSTLDPDAAALPFRAAFAALELVAIALLLVLLVRSGRSPWWGAMYAWHPLPLAEIAGSGHQEGLGLLLLALSLLLWTARPRAVAAWTAPLAAASLVKPLVLPAALLLLRGRRAPAWIVSAATGAAVCLIIAAPLLLRGDGAALEGLTATASRFTLKWAHFGPVYEPLLMGIETLAPAWTNDAQEQLARLLCAAGVVAVIVVVLWRGGAPWSGARTIFFAMVLLSPAAHPWYLLWALFLAPLSMSPSLWLASLTITLGYGMLTPSIMLVAWVPVFVVLVWELPGTRMQGTRS